MLGERTVVLIPDHISCELEFHLHPEMPVQHELEDEADLDLEYMRMIWAVQRGKYEVYCSLARPGPEREHVFELPGELAELLEFLIERSCFEVLTDTAIE